MAATAIAPQVRAAEKERSVFIRADSASEISKRIRSQGSVCLRVLGGSMTPWIRSGDLVFIKRSDFARLSVGNVVLFERDARFFVHRIIERVRPATGGKAAPLLITKGDALDGEDAHFRRGVFGARNANSPRTPSHRSRILHASALGPFIGAFFANEPASISSASFRQAPFVPLNSMSN